MADVNPHEFIKQCHEIFLAHSEDEFQALRRTHHYRTLQKKLLHYLDFCTSLQSFAHNSWEVDLDHPGYLRKSEVAFTVRAPYHIVPAFPDTASLNELYLMSTLIRTDERSVICLAGSMAVLKSAVSVSDIDFCEYVRRKPDGSWPSGLLKTMDSSNRKMVRFKLFGDFEWRRPFSPDNVAGHIGKIDPYDRNLSHGKVDYVANLKSFRPCEASNLLIFCDDKLSSASLERSFAAQEVSMSASMWIPNAFSDVLEMGKYYNFLAHQAEKHANEGNPVKAIKRLLSLSRFSFLPETSEKISRFIACSEDFCRREISDINSILLLIGEMDFPEGASWRKSLEHQRNVAEVHLAERVGSHHQSASSFCEELLDEILGQEALHRMRSKGD